ncbi:MAG: hypothetical protein WAW11_01500 [Patescibacteria group bacterium]
MKKISNILIIFALSFLISSQALAASTPTDCSWKKSVTKVTSYGGGTSPTPITTEVCPDEWETGTTCTGLAGAGELCCCDPSSVVALPTEARVIIPDFKFQINIPGLAPLTTVKCTDKCAIPWISEYFFGVYNYFLGIAAVLAVVILMAAGLLWIVSGGDASKIGQAKTMIAGSITGLLLLVSISLLLTYINPKLAQQGFVELTPIDRKVIESLAVGRKSGTAQKYSQNCATDEELAKGVTFYATGYYKPTYNASDPNFWCIIAMQCSCPNGRDTSKNCDKLYGKTFPGYAPCKPFEANTPYCNLTSNGTAPQIGTIAGPDCGNLPPNTKVCFKGTTYTITDKGGGIKGKRIDIWSGNSLQTAMNHTGVGTLTKGECK